MVDSTGQNLVLTKKQEGIIMKPEYNGSRMRKGLGMSCSQHRQNRGHDLTGGSRWMMLVVLCLVCCAFLVLPVAADNTSVNSTATLRISASISQGIGLDVEPVEDENVEVKEETYVDENGTARIKTVVSLGNTVVSPPEITSSRQKESDLKVTVSSNYNTTWQLNVASSNEGYMVAADNPLLRMKNPFYFMQERDDPRFNYVQPDTSLLLPDILEEHMLLIQGDSSVTNIPIEFSTRQEVTWDDMLQAERYWITLYFGVGPN